MADAVESKTPMTMVGEWEQLDLIGEGGQGRVYRARSPKRVSARAVALMQIIGNIPYGAISAEDKRAIGDRLASGLWDYARPDDTSELGALKVFKFDSDRAEAGKALVRFKNEITILQQKRSGMIRLLDCNENAGWMVTEYILGGTIGKYPETFKGDARRALRAFRSLVKTVISLHEEGTVHRDIKPANIFIGDDGNLVLGDFGIVFLPGQVERPTVLDERVGSRDYMPHWADLGERFEDVTPDFDVYMLGKLLWCMVSGRLKLPREDFRKERFDLTAKFPNNPDMHSINAILEKCIVSEQESCLPSAIKLLPLVEETLSRLERGGQLLQGGIPRPCRICGEGFYQPHEHRDLSLRLWRGGSDTLPVPVRPFICGSCHHIEFFNVVE